MFSSRRRNSLSSPYFYQRIRKVRMTSNDTRPPKILGVEEVWSGDQGQVTYWDDQGKTSTRKVSMRSLPSDFADPFVDRWAGFSSFDDVIDIEAKSQNQPSFWFRLVEQGQKLAKRTQAAWKAAWRELTREEEV